MENFIVTAGVIFVLQLLLNLLLRQTGHELALVPRIAVIAVTVTALMTWLVQPRLALLLEGWLYGSRRSAAQD